MNEASDEKLTAGREDRGAKERKDARMASNRKLLFL
jgi:hypothetical protein